MTEKDSDKTVVAGTPKGEKYNRLEKKILKPVRESLPEDMVIPDETINLLLDKGEKFSKWWKKYTVKILSESNIEKYPRLLNILVSRPNTSYSIYLRDLTIDQSIDWISEAPKDSPEVFKEYLSLETEESSALIEKTSLKNKRKRRWNRIWSKAAIASLSVLLAGSLAGNIYQHLTSPKAGVSEKEVTRLEENVYQTKIDSDGDGKEDVTVDALIGKYSDLEGKKADLEKRYLDLKEIWLSSVRKQVGTMPKGKPFIAGEEITPKEEYKKPVDGEEIIPTLSERKKPSIQRWRVVAVDLYYKLVQKFEKNEDLGEVVEDYIKSLGKVKIKRNDLIERMIGKHKGEQRYNEIRKSLEKDLIENAGMKNIDQYYEF